MFPNSGASQERFWFKSWKDPGGKEELQGSEAAVSLHSFVQTNLSWPQNSRFRVGKMVPDPVGVM